MMQKRVVEIFTLILYWVIITPLVVVYCVKWKWIKFGKNEQSKAIKQCCALVLGLVAGYVVVYIIVVIVYLRLKILSMQVWVTNDPTVKMLEMERKYCDQNGPRSGTGLKENNRSATLEMEDEEPEGLYSVPHEPNVPRPGKKVARKNRKQAPNRQKPPSYEECSNNV